MGKTAAGKVLPLLIPNVAMQVTGQLVGAKAAMVSDRAGVDRSSHAAQRLQQAGRGNYHNLESRQCTLIGAMI